VAGRGRRLEAGAGEVELKTQYNILSQESKDGTVELALQPKSAAARKMMPRITIDFDTKEYALRSTELQFADGSTMRNDFKNPELNPGIDPQLFEPQILSDYKVVEPLKK
jgi:outer membrane lipoprotein-sorting protein